MRGKARAETGAYVDLPAVPVGAHIHIVGIGGSGMSAIARVLLEQGLYRVSGSDHDLSEVGRSLAEVGAEVFGDHQAAHLGDADLVFASSAIPVDNPEVQAAWTRGLPVIKRPQVLAWLTQPYETISVSGTHGKTTTTAMVAWLLLRAGLDPSFIIGGVLPGLHTNARAGKGPHFVIEADEYDRTFLELRPWLAVVTNVEMDHPDCYRSYADVQAAFAAFVGGVVAGGCVVACGDDPGARSALAAVPGERRTVTYGLGTGCDVQAVEVSDNGLGHDFDAIVSGGSWGRFSLRVPGVHNVRNALAAITVARELGIPDQVAREVLGSFGGVARRFELKGEAGGVTIIDDYAHHPTEVRATLAAARKRYDGRRIWAVFQPHTFSRTEALLEEYQSCFDDADHVLITPIYASRERDEGKISSLDLVRGARHRDVRYVPDLRSATEELINHLTAGDVVLVMGAGDSCRVGEGVLAILRERTR